MTTAEPGISSDPTKPTPCTNTVQRADVVPVLQSVAGQDTFDVVVADPPYNIGKDFGNNSDRRALSDYLEWSDVWLAECLRLVKRSSPVYVYGFPEILAHIAVRYPQDKQRWLVWHYTNKAVPSSRFWQRSHESILCLWKGERPRINIDAVREDYTPTYIKNSAGKERKDMDCRYGREGEKTFYQAHPKGALPRDVLKVPALAGGAGATERWFYCDTCGRLCSPKETRAHQMCATIRHPTQKPAALTRRLLLSAAEAGDRALIPFAGSGAECVVAKKLGINFFATEINPNYVRLANAWLEAQAGASTATVDTLV